MTDAPRPVGRPTDYRPEYCEQAIALGKEGKGIAEIAAEFDVCKATVYAWKVAHPEFLAAMTRADTHCQAWWESAGRSGMYADKFNGTVWAKNMNCRFSDDWKDTVRQENTGANGGPIKVENSDAVADLTRRLARLAPASPTEGNAEGSE